MPLLKLSLRPWRNSPMHQMGSSLLSAALLLGGAVLMHLERSVSGAAGRVERETRFTVFVAEEPALMADRIRIGLGAQALDELRMESVTRSEVLANLKKDHPELHSEISDLGADGAALVPQAIHLVTEVPPSDRPGIVEALQKIAGVEAVQTSEGHSRMLQSPIHGLRWLLRILVAGVLAAWVVLWVALARSQAAGLEATQARLRLWGAGELESRLPGVLSGLWIGVPAAVAASASYWFLARPVLARLSSESVLFAAGVATGAGICLAVGLMSVIAGAMVGWISTQPR